VKQEIALEEAMRRSQDTQELSNMLGDNVKAW
jgi:hypothetical protein